MDKDNWILNILLMSTCEYELFNITGVFTTTGECNIIVILWVQSYYIK